MSVRRIKAGSTDVSVVIRIVDSTDGTPETGVVFNTAGIDLWYRRDLAASVDITEATLAALTTAHADGGFLHINDGWYRLDLPDAACASGVAGVQIGGTVTGMVVFAPYIELPVNTEEDVFTRIGAPAGASVSADIAAIEAQTDDIGVAGAGLTAVPWNAAWDAEVQSEVADALGVYDPPTRAELTSDTNSILTAVDAVDNFVDTEIGALTTAVADLPTNAELATALGTADDAVLAAIAALNNLSAAQVNAEADTAIADAALATAAALATVDTVVDAIKAKTDSLTFTVAGQVDANTQSINDVTITGDGQVGTEFGV